METKAVGRVRISSSAFPPQLKQIPTPPQGLYFRGSYSEYDFSREILIAVVGTRRPSRYGILMTRKIVTELSSLGVVIVSGLALGIDTEAHRAALSAQGRTIAVLGCGILHIYPRENLSLAEKILTAKGLILSEFSGTQTVSRAQFRTRNRLIAGLCRAVLVIEGTRHSGTLLTARYALEQGKEVMALPGLVNNPLSEAPHILLKQGAALVSSAKDVLDCLGLIRSL